MKTYIWASDAGHEWLAVKISELVELNIEHKITEFSYVKGGTVYLEGDCDAATFINAYTAKFGTAPLTKAGKCWDRWPGRSFARYKSTPQTHVPAGKHLEQYVEQRNAWVKIFGQGGITFPLTQAGVDTVVDHLNGDLSPENLHCDGEISHSQAMAKYRFYRAVAQELEAYCERKGLLVKEIYDL